jgi:hypothetical protein
MEKLNEYQVQSLEYIDRHDKCYGYTKHFVNECSGCYFEFNCHDSTWKEKKRIAKELLYDTIEHKTDCQDNKPKFQIGQTVKCIEHGTEFEIKRIHNSGSWGFLYYKYEKQDNVCGFKNPLNPITHYTESETFMAGNYEGVPESQLELVEKDNKNMNIGQVTINTTAEGIDEFTKQLENITFSGRDEYNNDIEISLPNCRCTLIPVESFEVKPELNILQKIIKFFYRRYKMHKNIIKLFPTTKEAVLVEKYFETELSKPLAAIQFEGKQADILKLAEEKKQEEKKNVE